MSPGPLAFGRAARLSSRKEFGRVFFEGRKLPGKSVIIWYRDTPAQTPAPPARLGLSISRKTGTAVRRNRLKRLVREAFRHHRSEIRGGLDMVVYLRPGCRWKGLADARGELLSLCRRGGLLRS